MQAQAPAQFERDMACTEAEWLRWLPPAIGDLAWQREAASACVHIDEGTLHLAWRAAPPRRIALLELPRLHVAFRFEAVDAQARQAFMKRFDLYMHRGGG